MASFQTVMDLAMMRNPQVADKFVERIFDPKETELGIELETRRELVLALLSNKRAVQSYPLSFSDWRDRVGEGAWASDYLHMTKEDKEHCARLWALAAKWPPQSGIPYNVYRHASVDAETKLRMYKECGDPILRQAILENGAPEPDEHGSEQPILRDKLLEIGKKDTDEECRKIALRRSPTQVEAESTSTIALSVGWHAATNLAIVAISLGLFDVATTQFETLSFAILILLYVFIGFDRSARTISSWAGKLYEAARYARILELLKDPQYTTKLKEQAQSDLAQAQHELKKGRRKALIYEIGRSVVGLLALYQMVRVLLPLAPFGSNF